MAIRASTGKAVVALSGSAELGPPSAAKRALLAMFASVPVIDMAMPKEPKRGTWSWGGRPSSRSYRGTSRQRTPNPK